jgi:hypothetical protein
MRWSRRRHARGRKQARLSVARDVADGTFDLKGLGPSMRREILREEIARRAGGGPHRG